MFTERVRARVEQREQTRQRVLESANRLFRQQGFSGTTVRQIAAAAGVSIGTVMAIGDKDGLLVAVFDGWIADVHRGRKPASVTRSRKALVQAIIDLFTPFLEYFGQDRDLSRHYAAIIVRGTHRSHVFDDLAIALVSEIEATLLASGAPVDAVAGCARTIYFAYLGIVLTGSNRASAGQSTGEALREVIIHVIPSTTKGSRQ